MMMLIFWLGFAEQSLQSLLDKTIKLTQGSSQEKTILSTCLREVVMNLWGLTNNPQPAIPTARQRIAFLAVKSPLLVGTFVPDLHRRPQFRRGYCGTVFWYSPLERKTGKERAHLWIVKQLVNLVLDSFPGTIQSVSVNLFPFTIFSISGCLCHGH